MRATSLALDVVVVLAFAVAGRVNHAEGLSVLGVGDTAWPFLAAMLMGWVLARLLGLALRSLRAGLIIWLASVAGGMVLRLLTGDGAAWSFVLVATGVLGAGLLGWRAVIALVATARRPRGARHISGSDPTGGTS